MFLVKLLNRTGPAKWAMSYNIMAYHIYSITETTVGKTKCMAIVDLVHVCSNISSVERVPANGIV